jgi:hypothetical protein
MRRVSPVSTAIAYSAGGAPESVAVIQISLPPGAHARPVAPCAQPRAIDTGFADVAASTATSLLPPYVSMNAMRPSEATRRSRSGCGVS